MSSETRKKVISRRKLMKSAVGMAGILAAPAFVKTVNADNPIKIGVLSPVTGAWTVYGTAHSRGFELAVEEINAAGGVLGRPIKMILAD